MAYGQGVFIIHSLVKHRHHRICGVGSFGNNYQKSHSGNVVSVANRNHNALCKSDKPLHSNGSLECIHSKGRHESFTTQKEICHSTFDVDSNDLAQGDLWNICEQEAHAFGGPCQTSKISKLGSSYL